MTHSAEIDAPQPQYADCLAASTCARYGECRALTRCREPRVIPPEVGAS